MIPNFKERLEVELLAVRPFQSKFNITISSKILAQLVAIFVALPCLVSVGDPILDAWLGASRWARNAENFPIGFLTRQEYLEMGGEYLKEHFASNLYVPTPK
jgi:actin-related protein 5